MRSVAVYCRISKDATGRAEGVGVQERRARKLAAELWPGAPVRVFADNDITAADPAVTRPGYQSLLAALRRGEIGQLVTAEQSRLTRQPSEWEDLVVTLSRAGITTVHTYRSGPVDVGGSRLIGRILSAVDAEEVERLKARINDKLDALAAEGRPAGGKSYGYVRSVDDAGRKTLVVVPELAEVVRRAATMVLAGWALTNIANVFTAEGVPTARGGRWTSTTVRSMLRSPTVAGRRVHRGVDVGPGTWEPILDEITWRQVCARLSGPRVVTTAAGKPYRAPGRVTSRRRYLLTGGIARCGRCGSPLVAQQRRSRAGGRQPSYLCHPLKGGCSKLGIIADALEEWASAKLLAELESRSAFRDAMGSEDTTDRDRLMVELGDVSARAQQLAAMWAAGEIGPDEWAAARSELDRRRDVLDAQLADMPATDAPVDLERIREAWALMTLDERRAVFDRFVEAVTVRPARPGTRRFDPKRCSITFR